MSIDSSTRRRRGTTTTLALSLACLALAAGCNSSKSTASSSPTKAAAGAATTAAGAATSAAPTVASGGSLKAVCPSAAEISTALGQTFPAPNQTSGGGELICNYTNSGSGNLVIAFTTLPASAVGAFQEAMTSEAQAQGVDTVAVSGIGDSAYKYTLKDASTNASGVATTVLAFLVGSEDVDLTGEATVAQIETVAHDILAG
jgi:hypothetical protein